MVTKRKVVLVRQTDTPKLSLAYKLLCSVHAQQLTRNANGIQGDEESVPAKSITITAV